ncbi:hypothetical protein [Lentzea flava]|uniref:DUF4189 domain-containing protein n=1 Tax=Lentzea flava TaxID=103732 RepID=A0ABQ2VJ19_9PSEU|nr:hypothetical protein [Lentzea flava]MCP2205411.1 hypothetical protein [Lentzea flava]GGU86565.1 hypothetical protein GCM10010178_90690 [Lentzea flava]
MVKKLMAAGVLACAALAAVTPVASASNPVFAGVYPNHAEAARACDDGIAQGRWSSCLFGPHRDSDQEDLWVYA